MNGIRPIVWSPDAEFDVRFLSDGLTDELMAAVQSGTRVISAVPLGDMSAIQACLRAGVVDVVTVPIDPTELARKARRAARGRTGARPNREVT